MSHYPGHLLIGIAAAAATLVISNFSVNRTVKRKLKLSTSCSARMSSSTWWSSCVRS
jgi:hypothetical protein